MQAAAVEASGRAGVYVTRYLVMWQAKITNFEEFRVIAGYLEGIGLISTSDPEYKAFVLTARGIEQAQI